MVVTLGGGFVGVPVGCSSSVTFADRWTPGGADSKAVAELFVCGEGLAQGAEIVLATLLHEAAHGVADVRKVQDTSRQGRYHNTRYKLLGEELGLEVLRCRRSVGRARLLPTVPAQYAAELVQLAGAITAYRYAEGLLPPGGNGGRGGGKGSPNNGVVLVCDCQRRIRVSVTVAALGPITCGVCNSEFLRG